METLHITFEPQEGALLRILGLIHRRGFEVVGLDMPQSEADGCKSATISMNPKGAGFRADVLQKQVERLIEVRSARVVAERKRNILSFLRRETA
jgi:acetolactate synthase II small subunit